MVNSRDPHNKLELEAGALETAAAMEAGEEEKKKSNKEGEKEGTNLLGRPRFKELPNGRLKCVQTGHETLPKDKDAYSRSKRCRLGLIDFALANNKPPLNMFQQDPLCSSKLICKLTGDTVNKTEEHIWKHINGRRFLNKLEQKETGKLLSNGELAEECEQEQKQNVKEETKSSAGGVEKKKKKKKKKQKKTKIMKDEKGKQVEEMISEVRNTSENDTDSEEPDFWIPPEGDRWDFDDGGDRWGSGSELGQESEEEDAEDITTADVGEVAEELSVRTKRMSIEIGPSSFASRKKKSRKNKAN